MGDQLDLFAGIGAEPLAVISPCEKYRYFIRRPDDADAAWKGKNGRVVFVALNPSTADATTNDPTIRKCMGFAKAWGFGSMAVVNLFAIRSKDKTTIIKSPDDPIGRENDEWIIQTVRRAQRVVLAWGDLPGGKKYGWVKIRARQVEQMVSAICSPMCLGQTERDPEPRHPLMLSYSTALVPYARCA